MLTKTKKNCKNLKISKKQKNGQEIWWIGSFPYNLAWIHAAVSEKLEFTDGRTDDGLPALLAKSSRAKK